MGLGRKVLNAITKHPFINGILAALPTLPYAYQLIQQGPMPEDATSWEKIRWALPPAGTFTLAALATITTRCFTTEEEWRTRIGDYKIRRSLEAELKKQTPPSLPPSAAQEVDYNVMNMYYNLFRPNKNKLAAESRRTKNPLFAVDAAMRYFSSQHKYDEALMLLRDAFDWLGGKKPRLKPSARLSYFSQAIGFALNRVFMPRKAECYMLSAALDAVLNPEHAWYQSALGKRVADTFNSSRRKEMYVFHALLALAQNRSDKKEAFKDVFKLLHETCTPRRLGESRHPAWIVEDEKDEEFFSGTFVFKGNEQRPELQNEWNAALNLEGILDETAIAPQPLYLTDEPYNGLYVYVMRYLKGELLEEQLKKGNKSGLFQVIPVLARILSRYPTEGLPRVDIEQKTYKKLAQVGMQDAMPLFRPVIDDLREQRVWAANKDAHPGQWQILNDPYITARVGVLDTDIREVQPVILDTANLLEYCGTFAQAERQAFVMEVANALKAEGIDIRGNPLFRSYNNAALHRLLCALVAWTEEGRNKTKEEIEHAVRNSRNRAINDMRTDAPEYYEQHKETYDKLPAVYEKIAELKPS